MHEEKEKKNEGSKAKPERGKKSVPRSRKGRKESEGLIDFGQEKSLFM
jgi:hypothetical protein